MNKFIVLLLLFMLPCIAVQIPAMGKGEEKPPVIEVSGQVRLVGSSPMSSLVISSESREWYIDHKEGKILMDLQHQTVTVKGREYYVDLFSANGESAGRRYYLREIKVVKK